MQTLMICTAEHGRVIINYNPDWSGDAIIKWEDGYTGEIRKTELPGTLLVALSVESAREELKSQLIDFLENYYG
jgi:hypothetical protein